MTHEMRPTAFNSANIFPGPKLPLSNTCRLQGARGRCWHYLRAWGSEPLPDPARQQRIDEMLQIIAADLESLDGRERGWKREKKSTISTAMKREQRILVQEIKALGRRHCWQEVLSIVETAKNQGTILNNIVFSCAISAVGRSGRWVEALDLLEDMRMEGIEPDAYTYNAAITACSNALQWERALLLLDEMRTGDSNPQPDIVSYNAAITACARGGNAEMALTLLREMESGDGRGGVGTGTGSLVTVKPDEVRLEKNKKKNFGVDVGERLIFSCMQPFLFYFYSYFLFYFLVLPSWPPNKLP
ncbi:unnamed protein product [Choristocarpus tenellus]